MIVADLHSDRIELSGDSNLIQYYVTREAARSKGPLSESTAASQMQIFYSDDRFTKAELPKPIGMLAGLMLALFCGCHRPGYYPYPAQNPGYPVQPGVQGTYPQGVFPNASTTGPGSVFAGGQVAPQLVELQRRAQELDTNNRQLTSQIAQMQQQSNVYRERADLLARQLDDATRQNNQLLATTQQYVDQARGMQASITARGGARLTANTSYGGAEGNTQIAGAQVVPDGNAIRVRVASDQLFAPGTVQLNPIAFNTLDQFAANVARQHPRQRIAIEGHTDASNPAMAYQLSTSQAQAIADYLAQRAGVPLQQLFVVGHGPNRPIADNNTPAGRAENRRIELVVQPEGM